jgi:hypothetical protein
MGNRIRAGILIVASSALVAWGVYGEGGLIAITFGAGMLAASLCILVMGNPSEKKTSAAKRRSEREDKAD